MPRSILGTETRSPALTVGGNPAAKTHLSPAQVTQRLRDIAAVAVSSTPNQLANLLKSDMALWGPIIKAAGIKGE